ncbi:histone-lysine N-methyltransferase ATX4-like protein [Carex littledalei]|uniref:Histone-lysine N-methyltransferase ATX4-like protein n=1 Tax=Carex littledalei TaxID=544730 RepID=A0A833QSQ1_9POAL|nr:histone-lysine N-methyltransferase ATX4-like protein [Carex littledalei]
MSIAKIDVAIAVLKSETVRCQVAVHQGLLLCGMPCLPIDKQKRVLCSCSQCNGIKLTPARFESHTGSRRKNWKLIVKVKGTDIKLDDRLTGKKPGVAKTTQRNAPITMKQKVEELLQEPYTPVYARWTTEMCAICRWIEDWDYNKMIICNRCQVAVHQECYGARDVNDLTSWVCRACEEPQVKRHCCLCPIKGGALKRTDVGDFWVHVTCTWFQPKMTFRDPNGMEPAVGVLSVPLDSFKKKCVICEQVHGACTKCCKCNVYYHAICASRAGYRMELHTYVSHGKQISCFDSYCPNHGFDYNFNTDESDESGVKCLCQVPNCQDTWCDSFNCVHNIPFFCLMGHFGFIVAFFLSIESIHVEF